VAGTRLVFRHNLNRMIGDSSTSCETELATLDWDADLFAAARSVIARLHAREQTRIRRFVLS
jgi:hypothetical protein